MCLAPENITLHERCQSQKAADMIAFIWNVHIGESVKPVSRLVLARGWGGLGEVGSNGVSFWGDGDTPELLVVLAAQCSEGAEPLNCPIQVGELCGM